MTAWPFADIMPLRYGVILADPPWAYRLRSAGGHKKSPQMHYPCMPLAEIRALPVSHLATDHAVCVMWATAPMLDVAIETLKCWGFAFKTSGTWAKRGKADGGWSFGTGYHLRSAAEFFLVGTIGAPEIRSRSIRNLIVAPVREHSRKPDAMHDNLEALYHGPYVELFARARRPGWDSWGNDVERFAA